MTRATPTPGAGLRQQLRQLQAQATRPGLSRREWMACHAQLVALRQRIDNLDAIATLQAIIPDRPDDQGLRNRLAALIAARDRLERQ